MKHAILVLAALAMLLFGEAGLARAGFITYDIVNYSSAQSGWTVSGSITTDGNIGVLTSSDIVAWNYTISSSAGTYTENSAIITDPRFPSHEFARGLMATATALFLPPLSEPNNPEPNVLEFRGGPILVGSIGEIDLFWDRAYPSSTGSLIPDNYFGGSGGSIDPDYPNVVNAWNSRGSTLASLGGPGDNWLIAGVGPVPEPSSVSLVGMATCSFAAYFGWRRRRRAMASRRHSPPQNASGRR